MFHPAAALTCLVWARSYVEGVRSWRQSSLLSSLAAPFLPLALCPHPPQDALAHLASAKGRLHLGDGAHGDLFYSDNRAGIRGTLHRISAMRDRQGGVLGGCGGRERPWRGGLGRGGELLAGAGLGTFQRGTYLRRRRCAVQAGCSKRSLNAHMQVGG